MVEFIEATPFVRRGGERGSTAARRETTSAIASERPSQL